MECDCVNIPTECHNQVSIHAPVWGATLPAPVCPTKSKFQSTHPCGVRLTKTHTARIVYMFQSTHPCGVRPTMRKQFDRAAAVSIHAPVWGATFTITCKNSSVCFNPRTRVGCDLKSFCIRRPAQFQSTHPCGVRLLATFNSLDAACFNPRTRVGCDLPNLTTKPPTFVSIHAPVWGATNQLA